MRGALLCALRSLSRKKLRTFLTVTGIAIGVSSVIIIGAVGSGGRQAVAAQLDALGLNGLSIHPKGTAVGNSDIRLDQKDVALCRSASGVEEAMPVITQIGNSYLHGQTGSILMWGVGAEAKKVISLNVVHGRMFTEADVNADAMVCLVDEDFAKANYKRSNITGSVITVYFGGSYRKLTVVGVVEQGSSLLSSVAGDYIPSFLYVPYTTAETLRGKKGYDEIVVHTSASQSLDSAGTAITAALSRAHGGAAFQADNMQKQRQRLDGMLGIVTAILSAIGAISLIVAGLSIMTVMTVSVNERTREIGIKKAIGAKKGAILMEFLCEALCISLIGAIIGIAVGWGCSLTASALLRFSLEPSFAGTFQAAGFSALIGVVFGVYPAVKASRLRPVDALRRE